MDMDMDLVPTLINNSHPQFYQTETMKEAAPFDEQQLANVLFSDDFSYPLSVENDTFNPQWADIAYDLFDQIITPPPSYISNGNNNDNNNNDDDENVQNLSGDSGVVQKPRRSNKKHKGDEESGKQAERGSGGRPKRKRQPTQVYDHILAERKRREVLSHMFISLSTMIPGLKKMDKTTILGDAIKHMKVLQEKVKELEVAAAQHNTTKSMVVVKKYKLPMNDDDEDNDNDDGSSSILVDVISASGRGGGNDDGSNKNKADNNLIKNSLPEIEIKMVDNTLLLKVFCENRKGILSELIAVVDMHYLSITNYGVIPFERCTLVITIVAQIEEGFNSNVKGFVRTLHSTLSRSASPCSQASN